jgi:hypothetical protein
MDKINYINTRLAITDTSNTFTTNLNNSFKLTSNNKSIELTNSQLKINSNPGTENQLLSLDASSNIGWKTIPVDIPGPTGPTGPSGINGIGPIGPIGPSNLNSTFVNFKLSDNKLYNDLIIPLFEFDVNANTSVSITLNPTMFQTNDGSESWTYYEFLLVDKFNIVLFSSKTTFDTAQSSSTLNNTLISNTISTTQPIYFCMKAYLNNNTYLIQPNSSSAIITNITTSNYLSKFNSLITSMRYTPYTNAIGNVYSSDSVTTWSMNPTNHGYVQYIYGEPQHGITMTNVTVVDREIFFDNDSNNNIYMTATISDASVINNANNTTGLTSSYYGGNDAIVIKINSVGTIQWVATAIGATSSVKQAYGLSIDPAGNLFVYGIVRPDSSSSVTSFQPYSSNGVAYGNNVSFTHINNNSFAYVTKYNNSGIVQGFIYISDPTTNLYNYIYDIDSNLSNVCLACSRDDRYLYSTVIQNNTNSTKYNIIFSLSGGYILIFPNSGFNATPSHILFITEDLGSKCLGVRLDSVGNIYGLFYVIPNTLYAITLTVYNVSTSSESDTYGIPNSQSVRNKYIIVAKYTSYKTIDWGSVIWSTTAFNVLHKAKINIDSYGSTYIMFLTPSTTLYIKDQTLNTTVLTTTIGYYVVIKLDSLGNYVGTFQMSGVKSVHKLNCVGYNLFIDYTTSDKSVVYYSNGSSNTSSILYSNGTTSANYLGNAMMQMNINLTTPPVLVGFIN